MDSFYSGRNSASAKVDRIVCQLDLTQANKSTLKIADNEYFRALKGHTSKRDPGKFDEFTPELLYELDRAVRERLKKGSFGYDNSEVINIHQDFKRNSRLLNDSSFLIRKLKQNRQEKSNKLTYQDWLRQKEAEERIKSKLEKKLFRQKFEIDMMNDQNNEEKQYESSTKVKKWLKSKIKQAKLEKKQILREKLVQAELQKEKEKKMEDTYKNWLREKIIKETEDLKLRKQQRKLRRKEYLKEKERQTEIQLRREQAHQEWLASKTKGNSSRLNSSSRRSRGYTSVKIDPDEIALVNREKYSGNPPVARKNLLIQEFDSFNEPKDDLSSSDQASSLDILSESY